MFERDGEEHLYLVRETKDTLNLDDLEWDEAMRIRFAISLAIAVARGGLHQHHGESRLRVADG